MREDDPLLAGAYAAGYAAGLEAAAKALIEAGYTHAHEVILALSPSPQHPAAQSNPDALPRPGEPTEQK